MAIDNIMYVPQLSDILLERGEIKAEKIWEVYKKAPRIPQVIRLSSFLVYNMSDYM